MPAKAVIAALEEDGYAFTAFRGPLRDQYDAVRRLRELEENHDHRI